MQLKHHTLAKPEDVHTFFRAYRAHPPTGWWFRGQANATWKLVPKAGRSEYHLPGDRHIGRFNHWTKNAVAYLPDLPSNEWERLAVAQHFGLATCLLDWSFNPLVALYFACSEHPSADAAVYCYDPPAFINDQELKLKDAKFSGLGFIPRAISARILNQKAAFTLHLPPNDELPVQGVAFLKGQPNVVQLTIPAEQKNDLLKMLDDYGVNRVTLFPDLEGLSAYVNWETTAMVERHSKSKA